MDSFFSYFRKYGFKLWLANLLGYFASMAVYFLLIVLFVVISIGAAAGLTTAAFSLDMINSLFTRFIDPISIGLYLGFLAYLLIWVLMICIPFSFQTAGQYGVVNEIFQFHQLRIGTFFSKGLRNTWKTFRLFLYMVLIFLPMIILFIIGVFFITANVVKYGLWIGILLIVFTGLIYLFIIFAALHAQIILTAENVGPIRSLLFSLQISLKKFGKVLGTAFFVAITTGLYVLGGFIIYLPFSLSLIDPTGFLMLLLLIFVYLIQWVYYVLGTPLLMTLVSLIIAYRYYKYLRPEVFPNQSGENQEPIFSFKKD